MWVNIVNNVIDRQVVGKINLPDTMDPCTVVPIPNWVYDTMPEELKFIDDSYFIVTDDVTYNDIIKQIEVNEILGIHSPEVETFKSYIIQQAFVDRFDNVYRDPKYLEWLKSDEIRSMLLKEQQERDLPLPDLDEGVEEGPVIANFVSDIVDEDFDENAVPDFSNENKVDEVKNE